MFCKKCGSQLPDNTVICPSCGTVAEVPPQYPYPQQPYPPYVQPKPYDTGSIGWWFLGFFIPLIGLILFLVWRNDKPLSAKRAGIGALVGVIVNTVFSVLLSAIFSALFFEALEQILNDPTYGSEFMKLFM